MDIYKQIAVNDQFNINDSIKNHNNNNTSQSITHKTLEILKQYYTRIKTFETSQNISDTYDEFYTTCISPEFSGLFKELHERLPEREYSCKLEESVYNGMLIFLQYLSPRDFDNILKNLDNVVRRINGMITLIHLPLKNNFKYNFKNQECCYGKPKYIDIDLYNKTNTHYNMFPTPCKLAIIGSVVVLIYLIHSGSKLICKCYLNLLMVVSKRDFNNYNILISTLLIIYNKTSGLILDDVYELFHYITMNHEEAFNDYSNILLFKEVINKMLDDVNNYNESVVNCTRCFIRLTSMVFNDKDLRIYELLEALIDRIKIMNIKELKDLFMEMYEYYLIKVPLACAATMLQTMELIFSTIDSFDKKNIALSLKCLESIFKHLPNDAIYYFADTYCRFIFIYVTFLSNDPKCEESFKDLEKLNFLNGLIVKFCFYSEFKKQELLEDREEIIKPINNILNITRKSVGEGVFKNIVCKINSEINNDPNTSDHTLNIIKKFYEFKNYRKIHLSHLPPRKKRITDAIRTNNYDDIRSLLDIHYVDEQVTNCDICGHLFKSGLFNYKPKFSCQLCNETYCQGCEYKLKLFNGSKYNKPILVSSCKDCYVYYRRLIFTVHNKTPDDSSLSEIFNQYHSVLKLYKDLDMKLLQLRGYLKLLTIHNMLKEPLPDGTKQSIIKLLNETTESKKQLSNIKSELKKLDGNKMSMITSHIIKSLNTLLTTILYEIVPEFNGVKNKLKEF